jgi:hypothetical protein
MRAIDQAQDLRFPQQKHYCLKDADLSGNIVENAESLEKKAELL